MKKCVLRIALVCPQVSFKVIDIEGWVICYSARSLTLQIYIFFSTDCSEYREDELFCTLPSVSPLPLVASSFGNGVSSSLRELKFYEGAFKISGYLSGPPDTFSTKVDMAHIWENVSPQFTNCLSYHIVPWLWFWLRDALLLQVFQFICIHFSLYNCKIYSWISCAYFWWPSLPQMSIHVLFPRARLISCLIVWLLSSSA